MISTVETWDTRLRLVARTLGRDEAPAAGTIDRATLARRIDATVNLRDRGETWLALATLAAVLPDDRLVTHVSRESEFAGATPLLTALDAMTAPDHLLRDVRIAVDEVLVDVHHTAHTHLATGIQRVARETARRWHASHNCTLVAWTDDFRALRLLDAEETARMLTVGASPVSGARADRAPRDSVVIPWRSSYVVPELALDEARTSRQLALARHSLNRTAAIAFDCVPFLVAETTDAGAPGHFANHLASLRYYGRLAAISGAAAVEYRGWRAALTATGQRGPEIAVVPLSAEIGDSSPEDVERARRRFVVGDLPMVLCVGTHEPRKNHGAVLHAAEALWRQGVRFSLTFVSGHSWASESIDRTIGRLQAEGFPVESAPGIDDELLWSAYRVAHCTVLPSFEEGFGLPVAESLAAGTPVVTSGYGSMREIAAHGGAVFVDPRDDESLTEGLRRVLTDGDLYATLRKQAGAYVPRTWDTYADETWKALIEE